MLWAPVIYSNLGVRSSELFPFQVKVDACGKLRFGNPTVGEKHRVDIRPTRCVVRPLGYFCPVTLPTHS